MKTLFTLYMPETEVEFSYCEAVLLFVASVHHYDGKCRQASKPGGLLFGLLNKLGIDHAKAQCLTVDGCLAERENPAFTTWRLTMDDLSVLCKIAESPVILPCPDFRNDLNELLKTLNAEIAEQLAQKP